VYRKKMGPRKAAPSRVCVRHRRRSGVFHCTPPAKPETGCGAKGFASARSLRPPGPKKAVTTAPPPFNDPLPGEEV
jgi:hypothetical protein